MPAPTRSPARPPSARAPSPSVAWCRWMATTNGGSTRTGPTRSPARRRSSCIAKMASRCSWRGLWSVWKPAKDGSPLLSCTIITTDAPGELAEIHDRMPLVVPERDWDRWLDPAAPIAAELLTGTPDVRDIRMREVSTLVNNVRNNGPELLEPVEPRPEQARLL